MKNIEAFPGFGGTKPTSTMNIQYEYDLITGKWKELALTSVRRNDQQDSKETATNIQPGSLNIRDLGYITVSYLNAVIDKEAYFLNRLPKIGVYINKDEQMKPINWKRLDKQFKDGNLKHQELEVYLKEGQWIKCRMIINLVPEEVKKKRIRRSEQKGKARKNGWKLTDEHKLKAGYDIFITNVPCEIFSPSQIFQAYRLRWQIELIFKVWKSNLRIDHIKPMKTERMLCQLYTKFIWILITNNIMNMVNRIIKNKHPDRSCSMPKYYKRAKRFSKDLIEIIIQKQSMSQWFDRFIIPLIPDWIIEQRQKEKTHCQILNSLLLSLS